MRVGGLRRRRYSFGKVTGHCGTNAQPRPASPMPTTSARDVLFPRRDSTPRNTNVSNVARKGLSDELSVRPIALSLLRMPPLISSFYVRYGIFIRAVFFGAPQTSSFCRFRIEAAE